MIERKKVLIIDDSALIRQMLSDMINRDRQLEVVGVAADPFVAREKIKKLQPDVLTLDVEMPRMDGITFLSNLMRLRPMPVIMVSSLTEKGADITLQALELGAIDFVTKPKIDLASGFSDYQSEIVEKLKMAAGAKVRALDTRKIDPANLEVAPRFSADAIIEKRKIKKHFKTTDKILAIGASTGGTEAIKEVLMALPPNAPGTVITQHIPEAFSAPFAKRMNSSCALTVTEATDGAQIIPGHAFIAPGNRHMVIERDGARFVCRLVEGPPVNRHIPSVDVMFRSLAQNVGPNCMGVLLTGMGNDGAQGMKEMHDVGAFTIAQDEHTSVVWGMPGEAVKLGCADKVLPLQKIAGSIMKNV